MTAISGQLFHGLVVLLRHLHPPDTGLGGNVGIKRTTSKLLVLVRIRDTRGMPPQWQL
ncbi:hypothetical protein CHELA40_10942 [Chelatococcus asaccharovorans]|nr:hypothetical protein CHELA40_10942 [Chelatococcus asaccharovorans]CAH1685739.1 hypothetical protein CHELA17_64657 [Chelatococcus asaccharovorans]